VTRARRDQLARRMGLPVACPICGARPWDGCQRADAKTCQMHSARVAAAIVRGITAAHLPRGQAMRARRQAA
jgi:hypothetical protein